MTIAPVETTWKIISRYLEEELERVRGEIRSYPAPIPACDAQFNYLLEKRDALSSELARARALMSDDGEFADARRSIGEFLNASSCLCESVKRDIRALVENRL